MIKRPGETPRNKAERLVSECQELVAEHRALVSELQKQGLNSSRTERVLRTLESLLAVREEEWAAIKRKEGELVFRRLMFWVAFNVPTGRLQPYIIGLGLGRMPRLIPPEEFSETHDEASPRPSNASHDRQGLA
jgi:hypothetical protein